MGLVAGLFSLLLLAASCREDPAPTSTLPAAPAEGPVCVLPDLPSAVGPRSVIFVLADTLRADRLGAYGGPARTPRFDQLAREGILFRQVWSQAPWTKPSIATLFTGLYPSQHRVVWHPEEEEASERAPMLTDVLASEHETLAEVLRDAGWHTAAIVSNPWIKAQFGFAQGFEHWDESHASWKSVGPPVSRAALDWLRALPADGRPFFLYVHYMDAHEPYRRIPEAALAARLPAIAEDPRRVTRDERRKIALYALDERGQQVTQRGVPANLALLEFVYDLGVEAFDRSLAMLLDGLATIPRARSAAIVVTSDHGHALLQRGWHGHGRGVFVDETGVPLVIRWPGLGASEVDCPIGLIDLHATLCDLLEVECGATAQGRSLLADDAEGRGVVISEGVVRRPATRVARDARFSLVFDPYDPEPKRHPPRAPHSLFDHARDRFEEHDLLAGDARSPHVEQALARLAAALEDGVAPLSLAAPSRVPVDDETRARLEALGYAGEDADVADEAR